MIQIAIVDDELCYVEQIKTYLQRYEFDRKELFEIHCFSDGDEIVYNYKSQYDIIFMDVKMKYLDGMATAAEIRKSDKEVIIIFTSSVEQYAIHGYKVGALDYVVKPIDYYKLSEILTKAISRIPRKADHKIVLMIRKGFVRISPTDIIYIESQRHSLIYHTKDRIYEGRGTMNEMEKKFEQYGFCRGSKGYLINLMHVHSVEDGFAILRNEKLFLSRTKTEFFMETFLKRANKLKISNSSQ